MVFIILIILALGFGLANGFNDAANAIATVIGTRVLSPRVAIGMAAILNFAGAATGTAVAAFIVKGVIDPELVDTPELTTIWISALIAVILWTVFATYLGLPISVSHSLISSLIGAGVAVAGSAVIWGGFYKVLSAMVCTPILGFIGGFLLMVALLWILRRRAPEAVRGLFSRLQILSAAFMSYAHGKNDGQMPMAVLAVALMIYHGGAELEIPFWVVAISGLSIATGTALGGWRVIRTLGVKITTLRPAQGFAAEGSAAVVIEIASHLGIPVSTTHCISSSIMGVGATRRFSAVRWGVARSIVLAWILTIPICVGLSWAFAQLLGAIF